MNARLPAVLRRKKSGWLGVLCTFMVVLSGCRFNPDAANRIAATRFALLPTETPAPPPPFLALCLVRATARQNLRAAPEASAGVVGTVANRAVLSVTLRSADAAWVYGMNAAKVSGWVTAASVACTVPVEELVVPTPTPGPITPTPIITVTIPATQTPSSGLTATAIQTTPVVATSPTPLVLAPTATATQSATATPAATNTPIATATPTTSPGLICSVAITRGLNVRRGPDTNFAAFYRLDQGDVFAAVGRSEDGRWLGGRVLATSQAGWIISSSVSCDGSIDTLAILANNVLPLSDAVATSTPSSTPTPTATQTPTTAPTGTPTALATSTSTPEAEPTTTATPSPTAETATVVPTPTVAATAPTIVPTAPPAQGEIACTVASPTGVYVRAGPSRAFEAFGVAKLGESFAATRRSANNEWLLGTSESGFVGWVVAGGMNCATPIRNLPVIDPAIAQTPLAPQN